MHFLPSRTEMVTFPALILGNGSSSACYLRVLGRMHAAAALFTILFSNVELIENNHKQGMDGVGGVMVLELFSLPFN